MAKFFSAILFTLFALINAQSPCNTPDNKSGSCIELRKCEPLWAMLQRNPLSSADRSFLSRSQCGYRNNSPYVCCASNSNQDRIPNRGSTYSENDLPKPGRCGIQSSDRIIGGTETKINEFPWMGLVEYLKPNGRKGFHCGSVLINENYMLTASHCINGVGVTSSRYKVHSIRLGEWDLSTDQDCADDICSDPVLDIPVAEVIPHENYVPNSLAQENDIALIRLSRPVNYTDYIRPICLPVGNGVRNKVFDGVPLEVAGWGKTETASKSNVKLKVTVDGVPTSECNSVYRQLNVGIGPRQLCAGGKQGYDSCNGDSGGPIMGLDTTGNINYHYLAGVVSFGPKQCGSDGWPGVYTRIDPYIDWIVSKIRP